MKTTNIPQGNSPTVINARRAIIEMELSKLKGKDLKCPCLGVTVRIIGNSISEIQKWSALSYQSTLAALDIKHQLKIAVFKAKSEPTPQQKKRFKFVVMYELKGFCNGKNTKIMVGAKQTGNHIQYCITANE
ncbi:MAG: hypothetical protein IKK04_04385 [Bacteroidales bacterium]|nr:hypothetical protein [Bacteroidales bacterium]